MGEYDQTPEDMAREVKEYIDEGLLNIIGGCCGTTPEHIKALAELISGKKPFRRSVKKVTRVQTFLTP